MDHTAFISVGSNMEHKEENCQKGISALDQSPGCHVKLISPFYQTEPVDFAEQDWFVNAVIEIETTLMPLPLLELLFLIQKQQGRKESHIRFGPRMLDLDIIYYDQMVLDSENLCIPHPRMHKRRFVLQPICDINSEFKHPLLAVSNQTLLERLPVGHQKVVPLT